MNVQIFIMDDDPDFGELIAEVSEIVGISAAYTSQPSQFETELAKHPNTQIIFLDLNMPGRDGVEIIRSLGSLNFRGSVVLMSGFDESVLSTAYDLAESYELNLLPTLKKPFSIESIKNLITEFVFHSPGNNKKSSSATARIETPLNASEIEQAFSESRIELYYQPQIRLLDYEVIGLETLARLKKEDGTIIPPALFIPTIEASGLNTLFLNHILEHLMTDYQKYFSAHPQLSISINVSALDLNNLEFPDILAKQAKEARISPGNLVIEITESSAIKHLRTGLDILARLRLKGFKLSIDDFGTGTAVLENIKRMPFTELKIDRVFVDKLIHDRRLESITSDTIKMAHNLNLTVVAEGIEDVKTAQHLKAMECDIGQGFLFAKPMPAAILMDFLKQQNSSSSSNSETQRFFINPNINDNK